MKDINTIAEIGINHNGNPLIARQLIEAAAAAGANMIKFQYRSLDNIYPPGFQGAEIGDEILKSEIESNYLPAHDIVSLADYARTLNISPGISFFSDHDITDISYDFDFYKIPSVEMNNRELVDACLSTNRMVYISTGCSNERQIRELVNRYAQQDNWMLLHCISNYPVAVRNAQIGYIKRLLSICGRDVGYSSHDDHWEMALVAASWGASLIERHITLDRCSLGLDHSSSSTPSEFKRLVSILRELPSALEGSKTPREPNQGELLNLQNLGRALYAIEDIKAGTHLRASMFKSLSPQVGISLDQFNLLEKPILCKDIAANTALTENHFLQSSLSHDKNTCQAADDIGIALPIRLHDQKDILNSFQINSFEYHLSYGEVLSGQLDNHPIDPTRRYSIHLPDYISPTLIIDPFSATSDIRSLSIHILDKVCKFANRIQDVTGGPVPIVGSFSQVATNKSQFYENISELVSRYARQNIYLYPQWLPPTAWYFGGSVQLAVFNSTEDIDYLEANNTRICFDVCHFLMCLNAATVYSTDFDRLLKLASHLHIADTVGIDGEGIQIGLGDDSNQVYIKKALLSNIPFKVLEVWQGHLNCYSGFSTSLVNATRLITN